MSAYLTHPALQQSLAQIAQHLPNFKSRPSQQQMIQAVFDTLVRSATGSTPASATNANSGSRILVIEGPTGTGKSLGYLLPAIVAAKLLGKTLVVSSATVMLQEQLANKDLPFLAQRAGLTFSYKLAKGRARYACPQRLYEHTSHTQDDLVGYDPGLALWDKKPSATDIRCLNDLAQQLTKKTWNGDRDTLPDAVPDALWSRITNDRHGCLKHNCPQFKICPFYIARDQLEKADIVIVNHDLLLADLAMGGGVILPTPADAFYCIDEAHHLSDKAVQQFSASHTVSGTIAWLEKLLNTISKAESLLKQFTITQQASYLISAITESLKNLSPALERLQRNTNDRNEKVLYRCINGTLPVGLDTFCEQLLPAITKLLAALTTLQEHVKRYKTNQDATTQQLLIERLTSDLGFFIGRVENLQAVWSLWATQPTANEPPIAKWITIETYTRGQSDYTLHASPVRTAKLLSERLWSRAAGAVLTSATLRSLGSFDKLLTETGLVNYSATTCIALPSPFNLTEQGNLIIPRMQSVPKNPDAHTREIISLLPKLINISNGEGTLMLFSSKKQMLDVAGALPTALQQLLLIQGDKPRELLLSTHFNRINMGRASVLFGMASFAEGLDLPGKACTHLIIAKLPFSMPDDPVGKTLAEWVEQQGGNAFFDITLPEASIRLIQAMGRLIRSETDTGTITIFDTRLVDTGYGRQIMQSLPPFRRQAPIKPLYARE